MTNVKLIHLVYDYHKRERKFLNSTNLKSHIKNIEGSFI